jgi:hypothetical protein
MKRRVIMPVISMFYGIIVLMFKYDNQKHHTPHIHVEYQDIAPETLYIESRSEISGIIQTIGS